MASPRGNWSRNLHESGWVLSVVVTIAGIAAMFAHIGEHSLTSFLGSVLLAILIILVGAHADGEWGKKWKGSIREHERPGVTVFHSPPARRFD